MWLEIVEPFKQISSLFLKVKSDKHLFGHGHCFCFGKKPQTKHNKMAKKSINDLQKQGNQRKNSNPKFTNKRGKVKIKQMRALQNWLDRSLAQSKLLTFLTLLESRELLVAMSDANPFVTFNLLSSKNVSFTDSGSPILIPFSQNQLMICSYLFCLVSAESEKQKVSLLSSKESWMVEVRGLLKSGSFMSPSLHDLPSSTQFIGLDPLLIYLNHTFKLINWQQILICHHGQPMVAIAQIGNVCNKRPFQSLFQPTHFEWSNGLLQYSLLFILLNMLRKNIRQRREYLFTLEREAELKEKSEKKRKVMEAEKNNSKLPTELFKEKEKLQQQLQADDINTLIPRTHVDDQYANLIYSDPQVLITTSRDPSNRLMQFLKQMAIVIPNAERINRGSYVMQDLVSLGLNKNLTDIIILHEHRGVPDGMIFCHLPVGPTIYFGLQNVVLRHDVKDKVANMPEAYPHLIFHNFSTKLGDRVVNILKHIFPVPKVDSKRVITFANNDDLISFRHHSYEKQTFKSVALNELGPRFEMKIFQISLGLINQPQASKEWVLRPYMNTATKRKAL